MPLYLICMCVQHPMGPQSLKRLGAITVNKINKTGTPSFHTSTLGLSQFTSPLPTEGGLGEFGPLLLPIAIIPWIDQYLVLQGTFLLHHTVLTGNTTLRNVLPHPTAI